MNDNCDGPSPGECPECWGLGMVLEPGCRCLSCNMACPTSYAPWNRRRGRSSTATRRGNSGGTTREAVRRAHRRLVATVSAPRARAEVWRRIDPGHWSDGMWGFQVIACPWDEPMPDGPDGRPLSHLLDVPGDQIDYPTWQEAYDAACAAVVTVRHDLPMWTTAEDLARLSMEAVWAQR